MKTNADWSKLVNLQKPCGRGPFAIQLLEPARQDLILNVGCFNGALEYFFLRDRVQACFGIDANKKAIQIANDWAQNASQGANRSDTKFNFQVGASENLPFADGFFDKVLCLDTFEHVLDEKKTAAEIERVLKPGGTLVLSVPHDFLNFLDPDELTREARNFVRKYFRKKPLLNHPKHRHYSEAQLREFFKNFTFETVHRCGTPVFLALAFGYTAFGLPDSFVRQLSAFTAGLENWDYATALPNGFNIMIRAKKKPGL